MPAAYSPEAASQLPDCQLAHSPYRLRSPQGAGRTAMANLAALTSRLDAVLARLSQLELDVGVTPADAVAARQLAVLDRIARLEAACGLAAAAAVAAPGPPAAAASPAALPLSAGAALLPVVTEVDRSGSEVQQRLQAELLEFGLTRHKFVRVGGKEARAWD